jgi:HD-GYP domain-containing protein (c-di-GMP phosphodiesterase class II)
MHSRERLVDGFSAMLLLAAAAAIALTLSSQREVDPALLIGLVAGYAIASRVRFEFADVYVSTEQLVFVPMLLLLPVEYVPLLVVCAAVAGLLPEMAQGDRHQHRLVSAISDSWFCIAPVVVVALLAPGEPALAQAGVYVLALGAQLLGDFAWALIRDRLLEPMPLGEFVRKSLGTARVDLVLAPIPFVVSIVALEEPVVLLVLAPIVWLLQNFSRDRRERYSATLELNRAYRGTVTLLGDVIEFDDNYTAHHSRSVVDLTLAVADEIGVDPNSRQELEFAALLHDVGKISIPKEILNKPGKLTAEEFELMKTHTIEGQFMLDRVGGLLARVGEIVRSCHERWDGAGYPDRLKGETIPLAARIVFCCDAYNAMTTDRPYRAALPHEEAIEELLSNAGTQFDPRVAVALAQVVEEGQPEAGAVDDMRALLASVQVPEELRTAS